MVDRKSLTFVRQLSNCVALGVKKVVGEVLFRILQFVVGFPFTVLICIQIGVAWLIRCVKQPASAQKVQHWQQKQAAGAFGSATTADARTSTAHQEAAAQEATTRTDNEDDISRPLHVFPDAAEGHKSLAWKLVGPYMKQYGRHAIANSQLFNPEYVHFFLPGVGSLPYVVADVWNRFVIIGTGEPLAPPAAWKQLTQAFLQEFPEAYFYHVTEDFAELLHDLGYYVNCCGTETTLQVKSWTYSSRTRTIRAAARGARDAGVRVRELAPEELTNELRHKLQHDVSGCWKQQKAIADRELRVFVRHVDFDNIELRDGVRIFVAESFDPSCAPPAEVDPVLQGAALNAKPPKPPRRSRSQGSSLVPTQSAPQSSFHPCNSTGSLASTSSTRVLAGWNVTASSGIGSGSKSPQRNSGSGPLSRDVLAPSNSEPPADTSSSSANRSSMARPGSLHLGQPSSCEGSPLSSPTGSASPSTRPVSPDCLAHVGPLLVPNLTTDSKAIKFGQQQQQEEEAVYEGAEAVVAVGVQQQSDAAALPDACSKETGAVLGPELVGFVLLDPLWEQGQEVGYVASVMRMKRSAHTGTLKLLIEDIISKLRKEGKKEFTFGFAPLFNMNDSSGRRYLHWMRWVAEYLFHCANNVYAFKNLAYSKVRYGAGLNKTGTAFNDPNVTLTYVYMAAKHYTPGWSILELYGFFKFVGIIDNPISVFLKLMGLKKGGENLE